MTSSNSGAVRTIGSVNVHPINKQQTPEQYLAEMEDSVVNILPKKLTSLMYLREEMMSPEGSICFDEHDILYVNRQIQTISEQLDNLRQEWNYKTHLHTDMLVEMEQMLKTREKMLDESNTNADLFIQHPELTHYFATKQADLVKSLAQLRQQLYASWNEH